jgi:hypothetical protein
MPGAEGTGTPPFRLVYSEAVRDEVRRLGAAASDMGNTAPFLASLKALQERMSRDPLDFGEPLHDFKHVELQVRAGGHGQLFVRYAVDADRGLVYPLRFRLFGAEE